MQPRVPFLIGLTGGIGCGKSTVSDLFRDLGVEIIDADEISRQFTASNSPLLPELVDHFGEQVLLPGNRLDRASLRQLVFSNPEEKAWLESLLHPLIRDEIQQQISKCIGPYAIVSVPLLFESGHYEFLNRILVVDLPESLQLARAAQRDENSTEQVQQIMNNQVNRQQRLDWADDIIDNSGTRDALAEQVHQLHAKYLTLSTSR